MTYQYEALSQTRASLFIFSSSSDYESEYEMAWVEFHGMIPLKFLW